MMGHYLWSSNRNINEKAQLDLAMIVEISVNKPKRKYIFASLK